MLAMIASNSRLLWLRNKRRSKGFTRDEFIRVFRMQGISDNIPAAVYDYYGSRGIWKGFKFLPDDKYSKVLYDDPDDIEHDARILVERLRLQMPPSYLLARYAKPIETLHDMVRWLDWVRQHQVV
jgi:hypothetical protein